MAIEVEIVQPERSPNLFNFLSESLDSPKRSIIGLIGIRRAELVIIKEFDPVLREEIFKAFKIFVGRTWAAVQREHFDRS